MEENWELQGEMIQNTHKGGSENEAALAVFSQIVLLIATLTLGHVASRRGISWIGEAGIALLLGVAIGLVVLSPLVNPHGTYSQFIGFKKEFFLLAILPPIMFEAGFSLNVERFFANLDGIATFAFLGTPPSVFSMGALVYGAGALGLCLPFPLLPALLFGSVVSATDPVTVLAVFQRLGAHPDLYALVFGESVLNDAVALVLSRSFLTFVHTPVTPGAVAFAVATFVGVFLGSMLIGCGLALLAAAVVRTKYFRSRHMPLESSLVVLLAFAAYMLADGLMLSGIVSALFCGMFMATYVKPNMTRTSRDRVSAFFKLVSTMAEVFVFLYIGASLFMDDQSFDTGQLLPFLGVSFAALAASRALNVWTCALLVNTQLRPLQLRIPQTHQFVLWWSGLRGAMAFAIALEAAEALPGVQGRIMLTTTYSIIMATVLINGGAVTWLLGRLGLKATPIINTNACGPAVDGGSSCQDAPDPGSEGPTNDTADVAAEAEQGLLADGGSPPGPRNQPLASHAEPAATPRLGGEQLAVPQSQQLRQTHRNSGLLRQWTAVHENVLSNLFLDGSSAPTQAPSIAGDIDTASLLGRSVPAEQQQAAVARWRRMLGRGGA